MLTFNQIGNRIKIFREQKGLSQSQLADLLKNKAISISRETISKIETGDRAISVIEIKALAEVLQINIEELIKEEEESDLTTLFRAEGFSEETIESISYLQGVLKDFIFQKQIYDGKIDKHRRIPTWRT